MPNHGTPTRKGPIPKGPFGVAHPLANMGVVVMVLHYYVLTHGDSWGSCEICMPLVKDVLRARGVKLMIRSQSDDPATVEELEHNQTIVRTDGLIKIRDEGLFDAVLAEAKRRGLTTGRRALDILNGTEDQRVIKNAIDGGAFFPEQGTLAEFRCDHWNPRSRHSLGDPEDGVILPCARCEELVGLVLEYGVLKKATSVTRTRTEPRGRLQALAQFTVRRTNLINLCADSVDAARSDGWADRGLGEKSHVGTMPADPNGHLPDSIVLAIERHPDRFLDTSILLEFLREARQWALSILDDSPCETVPFDKFAMSAGRDPAEGDMMWKLVVDACADDPVAMDKLEFHLMNHLYRRVRGSGLTMMSRDGRDEEFERPDVVRIQTNPEAMPRGSALRQQVFERIDESLSSRGGGLTIGHIEDAIIETLLEFAADNRGTAGPESELLGAAIEGDVSVLARSAEFRHVVDAISADYQMLRNVTIDHDVTQRRCE